MVTARVALYRMWRPSDLLDYMGRSFSTGVIAVILILFRLYCQIICYWHHSDHFLMDDVTVHWIG